MEDLVIGMNGEHAPLSVEVEIKQQPDDVTTLLLNLVVWSVTGTLPIANVVIWIHALQHAQLRCLCTYHDVVKLLNQKKFKYFIISDIICSLTSIAL